MPSPKFAVLFTSGILNLRTVTRILQTGEKYVWQTKEYSVKAGIPRRSRCLEHKRALDKCPKDSFAKRCQKKFHPDSPRPKCNWSFADDYLRAHRATKTRAKKITDLVDASVKLILQETRNAITQNRCGENLTTGRIRQTIGPKILELSELDPVCAMKKKHEIWSLNDRTQQELINRNRETEMQFRFVETELKNLSDEVKCRANCALALVSSCRKSQSPGQLIDCVEMRSREAAKILDDVTVDSEARIEAAKIAKDRILRDDEKSFGEATKDYGRNMAKLTSDVINCVRARKSR